jgi:hypothetical protein
LPSMFKLGPFNKPIFMINPLLLIIFNLTAHFVREAALAHPVLPCTQAILAIARIQEDAEIFGVLILL